MDIFYSVHVKDEIKYNFCLKKLDTYLKYSDLLKYLDQTHDREFFGLNGNVSGDSPLHSQNPHDVIYIIYLV